MLLCANISEEYFLKHKLLFGGHFYLLCGENL